MVIRINPSSREKGGTGLMNSKSRQIQRSFSTIVHARPGSQVVLIEVSSPKWARRTQGFAVGRDNGAARMDTEDSRV